MASWLEQGDIVLFQGDSITDATRIRENGNDLGKGYALMAAAQFSAKFPEKQVTFLNRGNSGNRVPDLLGRWQQDCLDLKPNLVSIYIGINDTWRKYDRNEPTSTEQFRTGYRQLLDQTASTGAKLLLIEPFVLPVPEDRKLWREDLDPKIDVVRELAREFGARLLCLDGIFAQASTRADSAFWAYDGVHPSPAGHALIANEWLKVVGAV
jgi:acyl-CoA thioesterase-1